MRKLSFAGVLLAMALPLCAQTKGPAPRLPNGKPDLTGVWQGGGPVGDIKEGLPKGEEIAMLPEAEKLMKAAPVEGRSRGELPADRRAARRAVSVADRARRPTHDLLPVRRQHPQLSPDLHGRPQASATISIRPGTAIRSASWEGDTLVVDTVGFNDKFWFDFRGHPHTEKLHTIERYTRTDAGTLVNEVTIDDPGAYTKPFTVTFTATLRPGEDLMEYICHENNQDVEHIKGPTAAPGDPDRPLGTSEQR